MKTRHIFRALCALDAIAAVLVLTLAVYAFGGSYMPANPDASWPASFSLTLVQTLAMVALPVAALAGSFLFRNLGRRHGRNS
jgi:hypothetical protein